MSKSFDYIFMFSFMSSLLLGFSMNLKHVRSALERKLFAQTL
jgi:hypothetical protein